MPIRRNDSDSFPGAQSAFVPPVTSADCCLFQTVQGMMENANAEGWPATVKGGVAFVDASLAEIQTVCLIGEPTVSGVFPSPIEVGNPWSLTGTNFGLVEGEVWLTNTANFGTAPTKVQQSVVGWSAETISMEAPVMDGLPTDPQSVWLWVINDCGQRNAMGFMTMIFQA